MPGLRVAIVTDDRRRLDLLIRETWAAGDVAIPLDPNDPQLEVKLDCADWHVQITDDGREEREAHYPADPSMGLMMFTSGSTGDSKGVVLSRMAIEANARALDVHHGHPRVVATCLSFHHCNAVCGSILAAEINDWTLLIASPVGYLGQIGSYGLRVDYATVVPAVLERIVDEAAPWPPNLGYLLTAAAPLSVDLAQRFHALYGPGRLVQGYGMTEGVNFTTTMPRLHGEEWEAAYLDVDGPPSIGGPIPGCAVKVEDGELLVRGHLMDGYWQRPDLTEARFAVDEQGMRWVRSGDAAVIGDDGRVVLIGRVAESINWRGSITYPSFFEGSWGAGVAVPVVAWDGTEHPGVVEVGHKAALQLSPAPLAVDTTLAPRTSTGKPQRRAAGRRLACRYESPVGYDRLLAKSRTVAAEIVELPRPEEPRMAWVYDRAAELVESTPGIDPARSASAVAQWVDAIRAGWPDGNGLTPELWNAMMSEWPMGGYGHLVAQVVKARWGGEGMALEIGHGVGNTSRHLPLSPEQRIVTDLNPRFGLPWDIDTAAPLTVSADRYSLVYGTNVLHCSSDPQAALERLRSLMRPDGLIVLGEGAPRPGGIPWALTWAFGVMDGWWDRGGFREREEWLALLLSAGFVDVGWGQYRAGRYDMGGVVWAKS